MDITKSHKLVNLSIPDKWEEEEKRNENDVLDNNGTGYVLPHNNLELKVKLALMDLKETKSIVGSAVKYELDVGDAEVVLSVGLLFRDDEEQPGYELSILHYRHIEEIGEIGFYKGHGTRARVGGIVKEPSREALVNAQNMISDDLAKRFVEELLD